LKNKHVKLRLGVAFAVLIALLAGIGEFGLRRMQTIDETLGDITGRLLTDLELARRAVAISNDNDRIVMQIVFVKNGALVETLLATRSENSKEITRLVEESERRCDSEKEKQLLSAVKRTENHIWKATYELSICLSMKGNTTKRKRSLSMKHYRRYANITLHGTSLWSFKTTKWT